MFSQNICAINGTLKDGETGAYLKNANIELIGYNVYGRTNEYGFYYLTFPLKSDSVTVKFRHLGYNPTNIKVKVQRFLKIEAILLPAENMITESVVVDMGLKEKMESTGMSTSSFNLTDAKAIPALLGEVDVIKVLQLKPGVAAGSEGSSGIFVRGGNSDQNLFVFDGATIYNPSHLFGFFSTFNPDVIRDVKVYKGGFPAKYGGRLSSVIDIRSREGDNTGYHGSAGIGLISSRLSLEGPIQKGKSSFIVSARRTYADLITKQVNKANQHNQDYKEIPDYNFYDINAKANFYITEKDQLSIGGYFGKDGLNYQSRNFNFSLHWGNATGSISWSHIVNSKLLINTAFSFTNYFHRTQNHTNGFAFDLNSKINDANAKIDIFYQFNKKNTLRFGFNNTHHRFEVNRLKANSTDGNIKFESGLDFKSAEYCIYGYNDFEATKKLKFGYGARLTAWRNRPAFFARLEPRLSSSYALRKNWALKASYTRMSQNVHLLASSGLLLPTDIWYPSTQNIKPEISDQFTLGTSYLLNKMLLFTWEMWYKKLHNQLEFIDGAELFVNPNIEQEVSIGKGYAYSPMEIEVEKKIGKVTGWIGYTLSWVKRYGFPEINNGGTFSPKFDTRHNISVVSKLNLNRHWSVSGTMVYSSGYVSWLPTGRYSLQDITGANLQGVVPIYGARNNFRAPAYARIDLGAIYKFFPERGESDLTLSIYNATNRRNPYFIYLEPTYQTIIQEGVEVQVPKAIEAKQAALFPILPTLTWNYKF